ncbi:hypothetical protein MD588_19045 [Photobacterium sp. SDRW27]|uniref:hypothetical protein n=1 Tax=Photobacterium obscurum TaxID=2829490 RepID=UPI002244D25F|nr:hypothetical protein [Photobacterium obscurum]MCW8330893.1 hypothetical protein [Photobacterium obscurum]
MTPAEIKRYLADNNLYIVKYGRGAVIIGLDDNELKDVANDSHKRDEIKSLFGHSNLLEVNDIYVSNDYLIVKYLIKDNVSVTREIPKWQVTFESYSYTKSS